VLSRKKLLRNSLLAGTLICAISTVIAYFWSRNTFLAGLMIAFVSIISLIAGVVIAIIVQLLFIKLSRTKAYIITAILVIGLIGLGLWGYSF